MDGHAIRIDLKPAEVAYRMVCLEPQTAPCRWQPTCACEVVRRVLRSDYTAFCYNCGETMVPIPPENCHIVQSCTDLPDTCGSLPRALLVPVNIIWQDGAPEWELPHTFTVEEPLPVSTRRVTPNTSQREKPTVTGNEPNLDGTGGDETWNALPPDIKAIPCSTPSAIQLLTDQRNNARETRDAQWDARKKAEAEIGAAMAAAEGHVPADIFALGLTATVQHLTRLHSQVRTVEQERVADWLTQEASYHDDLTTVREELLRLAHAIRSAAHWASGLPAREPREHDEPEGDTSAADAPESGAGIDNDSAELIADLERIHDLVPGNDGRLLARNAIRKARDIISRGEAKVGVGGPPQQFNRRRSVQLADGTTIEGADAEPLSAQDEPHDLPCMPRPAPQCPQAAVQHATVDIAHGSVQEAIRTIEQACAAILAGTATAEPGEVEAYKEIRTVMRGFNPYQRGTHMMQLAAWLRERIKDAEPDAAYRARKSTLEYAWKWYSAPSDYGLPRVAGWLDAKIGE